MSPLRRVTLMDCQPTGKLLGLAGLFSNVRLMDESMCQQVCDSKCSPVKKGRLCSSGQACFFPAKTLLQRGAAVVVCCPVVPHRSCRSCHC